MIVTAESPTLHIDSGLYELEAEFYTEKLHIRARMTSPERRLSDHLNSSLRTVDIKPVTIERECGMGAVDLLGMRGPLTKSCILFVVPIREPGREHGSVNFAWKQMSQRECWMALGQYSLRGTVHTDAHLDPQTAIRLIDTQFIALTDAVTSTAAGDQLYFPVVIVNRDLIDLMVLREEGHGYGPGSPPLQRF